MRRAGSRVTIVGIAALGAACAWGCGSSEKPKARAAALTVQDAPTVLKGTIGVEAQFRGADPVLVSGLGIVVGLNGTGGGPLPDRVAATMEREMALKGISRTTDAPGSAVDRKSPRELLRDPNVAVVLVQAAVPPAAPGGTKFDVYVEALNATSLEGGLLWPVDLRLGEAAVFGAVQARRIGEARGPVFINPFADADGKGAEVTLTRGRILDGGRVTEPMRIELVMDELSHSRASLIVSAINTRIPMGPGDDGPTAAGRQTAGRDTGPSMALRVPMRYRQETREFIQLVKHIAVDDAYPEQLARKYVEGLKSDPSLADDLAWCLEAVGPKAIPFVREMYDFSEPIPRLAALRAGARLGDERAAKHLKEIAASGRGIERLEAISLLSKIDGGPGVDLALRGLLGEKELVVRVAAYEALAKRAERLQVARYDAYRSANPDSDLRKLSPTHVAELAKAELPPGTIQGVTRRTVADRFVLDVVPEGDPLVYITQQGTPRIVLFGTMPRIARPALASAWENRFMLRADPGDPKVRVRFQPSPSAPGVQHAVGDNLVEFIEYLTRKPSPVETRPGLDMTYAQVVGVLYALAKSGATEAGFATERDRLKALILEANADRQTRDRPESPGDEGNVVVLRRPGGGDAPAAEEAGVPTIVPLRKRTEK